ncbi:helix-turn-helix transcriptional regulator [Sulfitobacter donghicola]|uniref:DNA-binding protein n=1 Tax=Sulfitobacter donghicola DSW-25 = KCTC 12864 = JCM 14565 TaxID=1300350 RepID=A0A073IGH0_9RHOB|nr:AraC family transcriptional regulator [Sulfitobacter donghicola]KEJ88899.1 DNA-binding protein [Sulfitobacter donghicola DSW-25 = KCTC 12864 = JCM 14565]
MSSALRIAIGSFGRVALLDMDRPLVKHAHAQCHALLKVEGADTEFDVGGRRVALTDESAVLINAWEHHSYVHRAGQPPTIILALYIEPNWLGAFRSNWQASAGPGFFPHPGGAITPQIRRQVGETAEAMVQAPGDATAHERLIGRLMVSIIERLALWREAQPSLRARATAMRAPDRRIARALGLMRADPARIPSMEWLARESGVSRAHFFRLFEAETGISPRVYLNTQRVERAVQAVANDTRSFTDISDDLGFSVPAHFSRFFHDHAGSSPSIFRDVSALRDNG